MGLRERYLLIEALFVLFVLSMVINKDLLQARKKISDKRPKFVRQESWRYDRLAESWRKPKGKDNKMRLQISGSPRLVKVGYRGPKKARGLHPSGYTDNIVFNAKDLTRLDPTKDAARIAHVVGQRKRLLILDEARAKGVKVLNPGKEQKAVDTSENKERVSRKKRRAVVSASQDIPSDKDKVDKKEFNKGEDEREKITQFDDQKRGDDSNRGESSILQEKNGETKPSKDKYEDKSEVNKS
jgi:large subunit ribosomal protein L32e